MEKRLLENYKLVVINEFIEFFEFVQLLFLLILLTNQFFFCLGSKITEMCMSYGTCTSN